LKSLKAKESLKEKRRSTIWGAHFGGEGGRKKREGGEKGGGGEGRMLGVCTSSKREA
jgi:hypothetical protein